MEEKKEEKKEEEDKGAEEKQVLQKEGEADANEDSQGEVLEEKKEDGPLSPPREHPRMIEWTDEHDDLADDEGDGRPTCISVIGKKKKKQDEEDIASSQTGSYLAKDEAQVRVCNSPRTSQLLLDTLGTPPPSLK